MVETSNIAPLTAPDCDLRGLEWMPLDVSRVMDSDMFALSTGEEFKAAFALWAKSWSQVPAASLPNDDRVLARLSGAGSRWNRIKKMALHRWVLCSDGRFYHPVVAEKAREAWMRRIKERERKNKWRAEKIEQTGEVDGDTTGTERGQDADGTRLSPMNGTERTGKDLREDLTTPSLVAARDDDDPIGWPSGHDGAAAQLRPPSDHRSRGQRTAGDVLERLMPQTGPPEKRLKRQDRADQDMANWLTTKGGMDGQRAWALLIAARDETEPEHVEASRELERISRQNRLGWFAEETA